MKIIALILALFLASNAWAVTEDQEEIYAFHHTTGPTTQAFATPPTAGCTLAVMGEFMGDSVDISFGSPEVFDSDGNTYTVVKSAVAGRQSALIAIADNISVTPPFSVTVDTTVDSYSTIVFKSFCGLANPAIDKSATATDPGAQASDATVTTAATTQANETVLVAMGACNGLDANMNIQVPTTGYTRITSYQDCNQYSPGDISWKNVTSIGAQSADWSHDDVTGTGNYDAWVAAIVTLKDAVPGGAVTRRRAVIVQ